MKSFKLVYKITEPSSWRSKDGIDIKSNLADDELIDCRLAKSLVETIKTEAAVLEPDKFILAIAEAQKRVNELNANLAEWYYVISNEVYEKIRLERSDFVNAKEVESDDIPEEAKAEAERILGLIVNDNKDFAEMAKKHSDGPSKTKGGDLGKFKFEVMAKPFSEAAFALEVGGVSGVVETGFGYHVIKRTE